MALTFEVYTYFGRVISRHKVRDGETHHRAAAEAVDAAKAFEGEREQYAWVRYVETPYV